jgi:ABC-type branched-subunit amino acid transport system substrate-binding protein
MKELNFNPLGYGGMFGTHAVNDFGEALGKDSNYTLAATNFTDRAEVPGMKKITDLYRKQFNVVADTNMLAAFAVLAVLKGGLEKTPTYDREKLKQAIDKIEIKTGEYNNLQIDGVKWESHHDNALAKTFIVQWENGLMIPVAPARYAVKKPVWPRPTWDKI